MHELSIAQSLVSVVSEELDRLGEQSLKTIAVRIGRLSDVLPDALELGFQAATKDTALDGVQLIVERVEPRGRCDRCGNEFAAESLVFTCPRCGAAEVTLTAGQELEIAYLEVDD